MSQHSKEEPRNSSYMPPTHIFGPKWLNTLSLPNGVNDGRVLSRMLDVSLSDQMSIDRIKV